MSVVMVIAFAAIYIITVNNVEEQNKLKLDNASFNSLRRLENQGENNYNEFIVGEIPADYYNRDFSILVDNNGIPQFNKGVDDASKETILRLNDLILKESKDSNKIKMGNKQYQFCISVVFSKVDSNEPESYLNGESFQLITLIDITDSQNTLKELLMTCILIGIVMLFIIFLISVYFAKRSVSPIEASYAKQKQFIADASHELKTPVASISANIDALKSNPNETIISQKKWIDYISLEVERMSTLVGDLLYLAKNENIETVLETAPINLSESISDTILTMEAVAFEKGIHLTQNIKQSIMINGDKEKIQQVIKILLDNAIKYVDDKGLIEVSLKETKGQVIFTISNTGEGIAPEHLKKIFHRFYRVDPSRKHDGSYGLGLAIAKAIVDSMKGEISVKSVEGEFTSFTVKLNK